MRFLWKEAIVIVVLLLAQMGHAYLPALTLLGLAVWATRGNRQTIQALTLVTLVLYLNNNLVPIRPYAEVVKWLVIMAAGMSMVARWPRGYFPPWVATFACYGLVIGALACVTSANLEISLYKLSMFVVGSVTAMVVYHDARLSISYCVSWFYTLLCLVLGISLPFVILSSSWAYDGGLFQGILSHPQALAVYIIPMTAFLLARLFTLQRIVWSQVGVLAAAFIVLFFTNSRTAMLALALATFCTLLVLVLAGRLRIPRFAVPRVQLVVAGVVLLILAAIPAGSPLHAGMIGFLTKKKDISNEVLMQGIGDSVRATRGNQWEMTIKTFKKYPLTGAGFGMAVEDATMYVGRTGFLSLPTSAPTELGFLPLAALCQTGLIGALLLLAIIWFVFGPVFKPAEPAILILALTAFFVNFGEMVFYSIGGLGLHLWLIFGLCHEISQRRLWRATCASPSSSNT